MKWLDNMRKSSMRGISLSLVLIFAITVVMIPSSVYAQEKIGVQSTSFEKSTIIEFTNEGKSNALPIVTTFGLKPC